MELETIFENGHHDELDLEKVSPPWSFGEWKDMSLAEDELFNHYCDPPRALTPLPADAERSFEDEEEWDELGSAPLLYSLYVLSLMGDETSSRKEEGSRTENDSSKKKKKKKKPRSQTKVILRRLPPTMTEGEFTAIMSPLPPYNYFHFCKADKARGVHERTYVIFNFISELDAHDFIERYHDCIFYDSKGNEYISVCHLAPSQSIPKENEKIDSFVGTMKESESYKNFLATYEESPETLFAIPVNANGPITPEMMAEELELRPKHGPESTPLLDFIRENNSKHKHSTLTNFKDATFSKKSSMDKMRTIKKLDKRKERRDRERKEKKEKDVKSKKIKPGGKSYEDRKYEQSTNSVREQDSSGPSSKSESIEASTSAKSSNPSITSASKENGEKMTSETNASRESKFGKDMKPKVYSDKKPRSFNKGSEFPGKVKDKTRWSKNSGLRTHYDDRPFDKKSSRSSKPGDKPRRPSLEKEGNVKTSAAETVEGSSGNRSNSIDNDSSKPKATSDNKPAESGHRDTSENGKLDNFAEPSGSTGKKVVIKKVIKKVRKIRADDIEMQPKANDENSTTNSSVPKKPSSAKKYTSSYKAKEDIRGNNSSRSSGVDNSKDQYVESAAPARNPVSDRNDSNKEVTTSSSSKEKEKRVRKGRPDLQIYRPGSLRSATSTKPSESNVNESKSSDPPKNEK